MKSSLKQKLATIATRYHEVGKLMGDPSVINDQNRYFYYVPFHALFDGERFLGDRFSISYSPSASVFCLGRGKRSEFVGGSAIFAVNTALLAPSI